MKSQYYAAIPLGLMLLASTGLVFQNDALAQRKMPTIVTIDEVPSKVRPGDRVTLTGTVMTADEEPLSNIPVNIYLLTSDPQLIVAASGVTGLEGTYEIVWEVKLIPRDRPLDDVTQKIHTQIASLFAQFEGDDRFASSKTSKSTVTIEVNSIKTFVNSDKKVYREGDTAIIFIGFVDSDDEFVDPDSINANFNLSSIVGKLEKKKEGSYTFVTPPLERGHNQVTVVPKKEGYNIEAEAVTITVLTTGSVGVFELP
ncbi:MAG: hypothetical protein QXU32_10695 [Nitrososphaerales archaeon]